MKVGIVGLGLIGGSLARALKRRSGHTVYGFDAQRSVTLAARMVGAINDELTDERIPECDYIFVCLYPAQTIEYLRDKGSLIRKDAVVADTCGVKQAVCEGVKPIADEYGFTFIGAHPMAGAAKSGFTNAKEDLFERTLCVLTPYTGTPIAVVDGLRRLLNEVGVLRTPVLTPEEHDRHIAYTSQLTHILASAYVRTPESIQSTACAGGSFRDATRVSKLNADMWAELCMANRDAVTAELDALKRRLDEYAAAIAAGDEPALKALFEEGSRYKELCIKSVEGDAADEYSNTGKRVAQL